MIVVLLVVFVAVDGENLDNNMEGVVGVEPSPDVKSIEFSLYKKELSRFDVDDEIFVNSFISGNKGKTQFPIVSHKGHKYSFLFILKP